MLNTLSIHLFLIYFPYIVWIYVYYLYICFKYISCTFVLHIFSVHLFAYIIHTFVSYIICTSLVLLFPKQALAYGVLTFDKGPAPVCRISDEDFAAFLNFCRCDIDIAETNVAVAARERSPALKVSSQSIVFLENVLWREFCNRFLCELMIYFQLFRLQTCLLQAHKDVLIARLARFAGAPKAALDPLGLPKDAKSLFGVWRWDNNIVHNIMYNILYNIIHNII